MSYAARLRRMSLPVSHGHYSGDQLPTLGLEGALALLKRSRSRAEVEYARAVLDRVVSSEGSLDTHLLMDEVHNAEIRPAQAAIRLLRESRTEFEANQAAKVLRRLISDEENPMEEGHMVGASESPAALRLSRIKVLVVEDDSNYRELLVKTLERNGASVSSAVDMKGAVEIVEKQKPDVIVSDINLPDRSGYKLMQWVQRQKEQIPVLAISGEPQDARNLRRSGFRLFFVKSSGVPAQIVDSISHMPEVVGSMLLVGGDREESIRLARPKAS